MNSNNDLDPYIESWDNFGRNLELYINLNKDELIEKSFDVILGFSSGGTLLALAFSSLIKDILSSFYSKHSKAYVRSIPKGFAFNQMNPLFENSFSAYSEMEDIIYDLESDLEEFSKYYNNGNPIRLLVMDDNVLSTIKLEILEDELSKMKCVASYESLVYVQHEKFKGLSRLATIIEYPNGKNFFIMPWHKYYPKRNVDFKSQDFDLSQLQFSIELNNSIKDFENRIGLKYNLKRGLIMDRMHTFGVYVRYINKNNLNFVTMHSMINYFYPPRACLELKNYGCNVDDYVNYSPLIEDYDFFGLCSYFSDRLTERPSIGFCVACLYLNMFKNLIEDTLKYAKSNEISVALTPNENDNLKNGIKKWFSESMPDIDCRIDL